MKHGVLHMPNQPNGYAVRICAQAGRRAFGGRFPAFFVAFFTKFYCSLWGGGICVGVLYIRCLNMSVPHVARELCMSILCMIHIYAYLCNGLVVLHKAD